MILGVCLPQGSRSEDMGRYIQLEEDVNEASSMTELQRSSDKNFYFSKTSGIAFRKFRENRPRSEVIDCTFLKINFIVLKFLPHTVHRTNP